MITGIDPSAYPGDADDISENAYANALRVRASLCVVALAVRGVDPDASDRLLKAERDLANAMRRNP